MPREKNQASQDDFSSRTNSTALLTAIAAIFSQADEIHVGETLSACLGCGFLVLYIGPDRSFLPKLVCPPRTAERASRVHAGEGTVLEFNLPIHENCVDPFG